MRELIKNKKLLLFIITLQEAFTAVLPYILLTYAIIFFSYLFKYLDIDFILFNETDLKTLGNVLNTFLSIVITVSIAYFFSMRIKVSQIISIILSISVFLTITVIENGSPFQLPKGMTPAALINPIVSTYLLKIFYPLLSLRLNREDGNFHIYRLMNYLIAFIAAYTATVVMYIGTDYIMDGIIFRINHTDFGIPAIIALALRDFFVQVLWFFGIHGSHVMYSLFGNGIFFENMYPNLKYIEFHGLFVNIGATA
ncbi:hypothetical protein [Nautilia sp.]